MSRRPLRLEEAFATWLRSVPEEYRRVPMFVIGRMLPAEVWAWPASRITADLLDFVVSVLSDAGYDKNALAILQVSIEEAIDYCDDRGLL